MRPAVPLFIAPLIIAPHDSLASKRTHLHAQRHRRIIRQRLSNVRGKMLWILFGLTLVCFSGCGGDSRPPTYRVTGKVTWKGQPVQKASLIFVPESQGESASAETDAQGMYSLTTFVAGDGARSGNYRIKVMKYDMPTPQAATDTRNLSYEEEQKIYNDPSVRPTPPPKNSLPRMYENDSTSGLTHTVGETASVKDIELK